MRKRVLSSLLAVCLLLALLPAGALAVRQEEIACPVTGGNIYFDSGTGAITGCDGSVTAADIPSKIGGDAVTSIEEGAFLGCSSLTSVTIPDSVTNIGSYAFYGCSSLTSLNVDDNNSEYSSVDSVLFNKDKTSLLLYPGGKSGSYTIPSGVTEIGEWAFSGCSLTSVTIPGSVTELRRSAFSNCSSLISVTIPGSVTSIGRNAFANCSSLTSLNVDPTNSAYVSVDGVLFNNAKTTLIQYPCDKSGSYTIPSSVTEIEEYAFAACSGLTSLNVDANNREYASVDGVLSNKAKTKLLLCPGGKSGSYTIPNSVTEIEESAFSGCIGLTSLNADANHTEYASIDGVLFNKDKTELLLCPGGKSGAYTIPDGVTAIGSGAFNVCSNLTGVTIPDSVTSIGRSAFESCSSLTGVAIPSSVTEIGGWAFSWCSSLTSMTIPGNVTELGEGMFYDCSSLTSVAIPKSVKTIWNEVFFGCDKLAHVYYADAQDQWDGIETEIGNKPLKNATIHYNSTVAGFTDVWVFHYYADTVKWAVENGVTNGTSATEFSPEAGCDRAQIVTFLWRAKGSPEPKGTVSQFTDVQDQAAYYYKAVLWAVENGITTGTSDTTFSPNDTCTRGQVVTFLHRAEGKPAPQSSQNPFTDVVFGSYYYDAVLWAVENGITIGTSSTTFSPNDTCTRGQVVTFLHRDLAK